MAGHVAVQLIFVESNGGAEPSTENWAPGQISTIAGHIGAALEWWRGRLPNARLEFTVISRVVESRYEPIQHALSTEGQWIGDVLGRLGYTGSSYFEQAYAADDVLRRSHRADWATTVFIVNSTADSDGRFADSFFAYAYIGGPFMVITSDVGVYGTGRMPPIAAHELGHIFGALDQYAAAATPCSRRSGYLDIPTTNSQANRCGTNFDSIMLEPLPAYSSGLVDESALGQIGYRDQDGDQLPDPLDTTPALELTLSQPPSGGRPVVSGRVVDQPHPSSRMEPATINTIARVEYRVDDQDWFPLPAADGAYDSASEQIGVALPLYDGTYRVALRALNSVGASSAVMSVPVTVQGVGAAPSYRVGAPESSRVAEINLRIEAPAGTSLQISDDPLFAGASWSPAGPNVPWSLGPSDGLHRFYVRFRDAAGLDSPPFARAVLLDRVPPSGYAVFRDAAPPRLELDARDGGSGVADVQFGYDRESLGEWQPFQPILSLPDERTSVWIRFRDAAGNVSSPQLARSAYLTYMPLVRGR